MSKALWDLVEKSRGGKVCRNATKQYMNLINLLVDYQENEILQLKQEWEDVMYQIKGHSDFEKLHLSKGGVVSSGDSGFYYDFPHWVVGQGKEIVDAFLAQGKAPLEQYIVKNKIPNEDVTFESLWSSFDDALELKTTGKEYTVGQILNLSSAAKEKFRIESLLLSGHSEPVGYRATFGVIPRMVNGKKVFWQFDVPNNNTVDKEFLEIISSVSKKSLGLVPSGDLLLTEDEIKSGIHAISLEGDNHAVSFIALSARGIS
jgi:hypothetical protein